MNDAPSPAPQPRELVPGPDPASVPPSSLRTLRIAVALLALLSLAALVFAWRATERAKGTERELVRRQQESATLVTESTLVARQAQEDARDAAAKVAILEARLNEVALQRSQLEALVQSVARARDDNLVADGEATLRAALQQSALTGSSEPVVAALKQLDDRFAHANQPRLEPVRRALARDLDRIRAASFADVATLSLKIEEAVRMVDELPLLAAAEQRRDLARGGGPAAAPASAAASAPTGTFGNWLSSQVGQASRTFADSVWTEIRSLVRVSRIDHPEAMLVAPDQAIFLRENLKLRLLNARLSLLARQFDAAQFDLRRAIETIERYGDRSAKRTQVLLDVLMQVAQQARQSAPARPDDTFAALAAVAGPR